jgi:hypothetical protein
MLGWRKLTAWALVFALCAAVSIKAVWMGAAQDIPPTVADVIKWVTAFFFGMNVLDKLTDKYTIGPGGLTPSEPKP